MSSDFYSRDVEVERGPIPLDIDNVHMLLQVEQEQIQKKTFTNWVNAQLGKRRPPCVVVDLFNDFRDGSKLLDLLEVMSGQRLSRERGRGMFQHRSNIEKALSFLKKKSIKLVNINIPDIIDGKPSIILGLIWTIILQYHIEELASGLSFSSRQSSMESLATLDSRSTLSSRSTSSSPVPPRGSPLHKRFRVSAKKALLLWVREQCHKAGCSLNVKDFKASWRSGVVFLAILYALRPELVDLSKARTRSNRQNLEEAFRIAERELRIPRLLDPDDVDVRDPDEKSIMTYVAQFLQYSRDLPVSEEEIQTQYPTLPKSPSPVNLPAHYTPAISASPLRQATPERKAQEVTCWLAQAYDELLEGWDSTEGESYSERYHVFQTFLVSFNEQRRPVMPLLTAMRRTPKPSEEQRALREAWDTLTEKLREYKIELDMSLPAPLDTVACWLLKTEGALAEEEGDPQDHSRAAEAAREKQELLKVCLEEMPRHMKTFQSFQKLDEYGNMLVPIDKMDELKRRFTSVRVSSKYHGIKLEYREHRHTVLDLLGQIKAKLRVYKRPYISPEAVRVLLQEWHELVNTQELPSSLKAALHKLKQVSEKYSSKSALASDYHQVSQQVKQLEEDTAVVLEELMTAKSTMGRVLSAWDSYNDCLSSLQAWLEQGSVTHSHGHRSEVTSQTVAEWGSRQAHLNEVGNLLIESTDPQTSRSLAEELRKLNMHWAEFVKRNTFDNMAEPGADVQARPQDIQSLIREATLILKEPLEAMAGPLRTYRKRIQFIMNKIKEVDLEALGPSPECPAEQLQKVKLAIPEVMQTLFEAEQVCAELQHSVSGLDGRLAELLHWEIEARELYQLLRAAERQKQRGQDPRARVLISRGLQLEGQVVTEEQDLQVVVMTNQKNSPIQYLHATTMQDRVRATVAQSQEAVGMLSSLGARRDRSRSPPEGLPSPKVFKATGKPQHLGQSNIMQQTQQPEKKMVSHQSHETFLPKIVVQEYREEKMTSPPVPYTYTQAEIQTRTKSPSEGQADAGPDTAAQTQQQTQEHGLIPELLQDEQVQQQTEKELQKQGLMQPQTQEVQQQELMPTQPQQWQQKREQQELQQQVEMREYQVQHNVVTHVQVESQVRQTSEPTRQTSPQPSAVKNPPLSSQELQSRKAQALKNRPWLQKPASGEHKTPAPHSQQDSTQEPIQTEPQSHKKTVDSVQVVPQHTAATSPQLETHAKVTKQPQRQQKEQEKQTQPQNLGQQQEQLQHQQQHHKEKQQQQLQQLDKQQKPPPPQPHPVVSQAQQDSETKAGFQTATMAQPHPQSQPLPQTVVQSKPQAVVPAQMLSTSVSLTTTDSQQPLKTMSQTRVSQGQSQTQVLPQPHGPMWTQSSTQPQVQTQSQTCVPAGQPQGVAHGPAVAQMQTWAQVGPSTPMQVPLQGQIQPPVPSHIQLRTHPQSWAPVRPSSPKPPAHGQIQCPPQPIPQPQPHPQPKTQPQVHAQSVAQAQTHAQPSHAQFSSQQTQVVQAQSHSQPMTQYPIHAQPAAQHLGHISQGQVHSWTQVGASSPMSIQHPQATTQTLHYPQSYSQGQMPSQQWTPKQEPETQAIAQQRHPMPQPYPQQIGHTPQSQAYPTAQALPQWPQAGPQLRPQMPPPGYSQMGPSYTQPPMQPQTQTQPWAQTQPQMRPQSSTQQQPQMRAYDMCHIQTQQGQVQQQTWIPAPPQLQPQPYPQPHLQPQSQQYSQVQHQPQTQRHPQPQMQAQIPRQSLPQHQAHYQFPSQPQIQQQLQVQSQTHIQTQPSVKVKPQAQQPQFNLQFQQPPPQSKHQSQLQPQPTIQSPTQPKGESPPQPKPLAHLAPQPKLPSPNELKAESLSQPISEPKLPPQPMVLSPMKVEPLPQPKWQTQTAPPPEVQSPTQPQAQMAPLPEAQSPTQPKFQSPTQPSAQTAPLPEAQSQPTQPKDQSPPLPKPQAQLPPQPQLQAQSPPLPKAQTAPQSKAQSPPQARPQTQQQSQTTVLSQVSVLPQAPAESPDLCIKPPALAQVPSEAYTEAYAKVQALARNGFEDAKHCLQEHIMETINIFEDKRISAEQVSVKEETLRTLDPELLEEFLRAAKGMEAFCTPSELTDMEFYTQSVRTQWEAVRADISGFLQYLCFEVTRKAFNTATQQCEMHLISRLESQAQACISADVSFAQAGQHLKALKELCDTLSPEDAHRLAQTQLRECEKRLAAIQRQFSGDQEAPVPDSRIPVAFSEDLTTQKEPTRPSDKPQVSAELSQVTMKTASVERREVEKQASVEEEVTKKEALERYENFKRTLQTQLAKNEQSIKDLPSDSVSLKGLHTRLQEIQFLRQETESLWSEYANQCSQCCQMSGNTGLEQDKTELQDQWRGQQSSLQRRGSSLGAALRQIDSTENHMVDFNDRLDRYLRQPKDITAFTLANTNILKDIKELDDNIQSELDQLSRLDPESSDLDPRDCFPLSREVGTHSASLDQLRQQVRKSEAAARALDRFLMSLRTVDEDISGVQGAPCSDTQVLQDCRSKLALIRQNIDSLKEKAPQLDVLLQGARLTVTRDGVPASCLDMVTALLRRLEDADAALGNQLKGLQKEMQSKSLGLRKRTQLGELRKLQETIETQGLKEPTMPAVQHRLRALSDLEGQLQAQQAEIQNLRELQEKQGGGENLFQDLETQWKETQRAFSDRKKQCSVLLELLKKFQSCRSHLSNTMQRAEQTISDQASYMGKDNLQRSITKVRDIKEELGGLGENMEEMRGVCRQLQSQLKKFPDCSEAPFEAEADTLMDNWLDVTEKTDTYMDNLRVALELWEKQLMLGGEVDGWAGAKLAVFAASHPFHNEQQVLDMRDEIHANEDNVEHFHKKSVEIQEMLQSQEAPLELQVMETQLRKRMQQVKELFTDCTDVFEELVAVKTHLSEKIEECQTAVETIQCSLSDVDASQPKFEAQIQDLCDELEAQEEQAEAVLKEVGLVSSVASPQVLEALSVDCSRLREAISRTKDMIHLKREERDKGLLKVIKDEKQSFEGWFQDLQLCVNECFENPESRADVETSVQRLTAFLKSKDAERRLDQLKDQLGRGSQQVPPQQLSELNDWLREQQGEVGTFRAHCQNRQKQMESLLSDLNSLQKQHDSFRDWLQTKEKQSVEADKVKLLLKGLQDESGRAETLSELLASVRRQNVRAESLLKDSDNLIQRYRNLEARLQKQADAQSALEGEFDKLNTQAEGTRGWIRDLLQPLSSADRDTQTEEMKHRAQAILSSKPEGDAKVNNLRRQSESLCEQQDLEEGRKQEVQRWVRETEEQWRAALQTAEGALNKAQIQAQLEKDLDTFKTQNDNVQSWIRDQEQNLGSLGGGMQVEEKLPVIQATLSSKPDGDSKLQDLKQRCQGLCDNQGLDESRRREAEDALRQTEERWRKVLQAAEDALKRTDIEAATERDFDAFRTQSENIQSWMKEQKQTLLSHSSQRSQVAQAVLSSKPEGESKVLDLKRRGESLCEHLEESKKPEVQQLVKDADQQWRTVLQAARQAELRGLSDDFDTQRKDTESWIRDKQQKLQSVGSHTPPEERSLTAQTILNSRPDGDCKVNNLRRQGQNLCDHPHADEGRKAHVQQTVRETEEQWRTALQAAKQVGASAEAEITQESERRKLELRKFDTHQQEAGSWITDLQKQLDLLDSQTRAEDRLHTAQAIMSSRPEGDAKLHELRSRGQSLCGQDLEEHKKQEVQQKVRDVEEKWAGVLKNAKQAVDQAERQCALEGQLRDYDAQRGDTRAWLEDKQQRLSSLDSETDPEKTINTAQTILSCKPEGDSKLTELRRQSQSLSDQEELEESTKQEAQQAVKDSEEQWRTVLQSAEDTLKKAEVQYSLSRELEAFRTQAGSTRAWVKELQQQAESKGSGTQGSQAQIEDRLNTAQVILSSKSNGEAQVMELKRRAQSLCEQRDLEGDKKLEVQQTVKDAEQQWRTVLQAAEDTQRQLKGVMERLVSCRSQRDQAEARLSELQKQTSGLPRVFPWPGLGERRQAVEQARILLDQNTALAPTLSDVRTKAAELLEITQDRGWSDISWAAKEESIPALLKELTDAVADLEQGILTERECTQLVEQHEAAQDWLREQVKGLGPPPADRRGLHNTINTLKALLQTVDREQREMKELDSARDSLLSLCTAGGQDALTLEVSHLHDLCASSEQEVRERLTVCETRLRELDSQLAKKAQGLKERSAALQWELRSLDQALSYSKPQNNIAQLQQHWHSLQNCEKSLEGLGVKVHDLYQEVKATPATDELPAEIITAVESLCQQNDSLKSRLSEHQDTCSANTARCLIDSVHSLQEWNQSETSESSSPEQVTLEEGEKLQVCLREALSYQQFLKDCLMPDLFEKLEREGSDSLREADTHKASLSQRLKDLDERSKQKLPDAHHGNLEETKTSVVAPPRKSKHSPEKKSQVKLQKNISGTEKSTFIEEKLTVSAELSPTNASEPFTAQHTQFVVEVEQTKPAVEESVLIQKVTEQSASGVGENTTPVPSRRKSKTPSTNTESAQTKVEPKMGKTVTPHASPRHLAGTAAVEKAKNKATIILDESESLITVPIATNPEMPTRKKSKSAELPLQLANTEAPHPGKELDFSTTSETNTHVRSPDEESSTSDVVKGPTQSTTTVEKGKLSPTKRTSKGVKFSPEPVTTKLTKTKEKPDSQKPSSTSGVVAAKTEVTVLEKGKLSPTKRKSKALKPSSEPTTTELMDPKKEEPDSLTSSAQQIVTEAIEAAVSSSKLSPTKRRSKGLKPSSEPTTTELMDLKKETVSQPSLVSSRETTEAAVLEEFTIPARRKSKSLDVSTVVEPVSALGGTIDVEFKTAKEEPDSLTSSAQQIVTEAIEAAVSSSKLSPTKRGSKGVRFSPQPVTTELTKTKGKPDSQKPSSAAEVVTAKPKVTVLEKGKLSPTKRQSKGLKPSSEPTTTELIDLKKEEPDSLTSSAQQIVTEAIEAAVSSSKLSPTKRRSKGLKPSSEPTTTELMDLKKEEPDSLTSSAQQIVTEAIEAAVSSSKLSPTKRGSKGVRFSPQPVTTELTKTKGKPDSQKPSSTSGVVTAKTEVTVLEKGKLSPTKRQSKGLKPSSEPTTTELMDLKKEEPDSLMSSAQQIVTEAIEAAVSSSKLSPTKRRSNGVKPSSEPVTTKTKGKPDSQKERKRQTEIAVMEETKVILSKKMSTIQEFPGKKVATIILDSGENIHTQTPGLVKVDTTCIQPPEKVEITSTAHAEPLESVLTPISTTAKPYSVLQEPKDRPKEAPEQTISQSTGKDSTTVPQIQPTVSTEPTDKLWKNTAEIQKRYLVLDLPESGVTQTCKIQPVQSEAEVVAASNSTQPASAAAQPHNVTTDKQPMMEMHQSSTKCETEAQSKDMTTTDNQPEEAAAERTRVEVQENITECQGDNVVKSDFTQTTTSVSTQDMHDVSKSVDEKSVTMEKIHMEPKVCILQLDIPTSLEEDVNTKPISPTSESLQSLETETDLIEIHLYEQDIVKPSPTETKRGLLKTTQDRPTGVKEPGVQQEDPQVTAHSMQDVPKCPDERSVRMETIHLGPEVCVLQLDIPTHLEEHENTIVTITKEPKIDTVQTRIQPGRVPGSEDKTTSDDKPEKAAVKTRVQQISTERPENVAQGDSTRPTSVASAAVQPSEAATTRAEISQSEQDPVKPSGTLIHLESMTTTQEGPDKVEDRDMQEVSTRDVHDAPQSLDETSVRMEKIHKGAEVCILLPDTQATIKEHGITSVTIEKAPRIDIVQTSVRAERVPESKDKTVPDAKPEEAAVETREEGQEISTERQETVTQGDSSVVSALMQINEAVTTPAEISLSEQDTVKPSESAIKLESMKTTQDRPEEVKDHDVHAESVDETSVRMEKIHKVAEVCILDQSSIQGEKSPENKDVTSADVQPEELSVKTTPSEPGVVHRAQTETHTETQNVPHTTTTGAARLQRADSPQADNISPEPLQTVQKSSTDSIWGEVTPVEGLPSQDHKDQAETEVKTEKLDLDVPEGSAMMNIFAEIQLLAGTGPNRQLIEGKPVEDAPDALITSTSDLDNRLSRLVSKLLSCKNHPAELNPTAMAQQLEEAQECHETAQAQASLLSQLSQLRGADAENRDALEHVEDQWNTAVQDAAAVIQSKEAQLQMVTDHCRQTQAAQTTLERLTAELDAVRISPEESSSEEAGRLCSLQRSMEENRTVLGELLVTHTKLCPHLSQRERTTAETEQKNLQEKWRALEGALERTMYHINVHSHENSSLLSGISALQEHLETISKDLEAKAPSVAQWNCTKAQQLMGANAEVKAAQQKHLHLQQLSEVLLLRSQWEKETNEIQQGLQRVKEQLSHTEELVSSQTQSSSNPIMEKIIVVMRDGFAWAKQTESDIEGRRKRVALLPEEVHRQLRDLKKLQSEVMTKQGQLETLVEEVTELLPQLDQAEEVPMVRSSLGSLEELSKSTTEKLAKAVREIETGLQTREKLSEQIADLDSWVVAHLHREASRSADSELRSPTELDRRVRQIQETLAEAEKQAAVCDALLMKSKDIAPELSITENCQLFDKLTNLQEDIRAISNYEKTNRRELDELTQVVESSKKNLATIEKSLQQMLGDLSRHRYPITRESLQALEPFKHMVLEHKSQVDLLQPWIPQEKTRELHSVISEIHRKIVTLEMKARDHERYLNTRQNVEDLRENVQKQVPQTKDDSREYENKYKVCQTLLVQFPLMKYLSEEALSNLQMISTDLYPSQLCAEQQRLKQNQDSLDTLEMTLSNNLSIIERTLLKELDLSTEREATRGFLSKTQQELQKLPVLEPNETAIDNEYQRTMCLKKTVESRMRALDVVAQNKGSRKGKEFQDLMDLNNAVLSKCDSQMENISQARESLRSYTCAVKQAAQFLRDIEASLLPPQGSAGLCSDRLEETRQALDSLQQQFQTHVERLQKQASLHPCLSPQKVDQLQENILSQLLVRMSTLQAKGHILLERLSRCAENHKKYTKCQDEILQSVKNAGNVLSQVICQKVTCLSDCTDQQAKLRALCEEVESLQRRLEELEEWCPEQSCRGGREASVSAVWKRVSRLRHCTQELATRSNQRIAEWSEITDSVEKAAAVLEQVEAELPDGSRVKASTEELQDVLQSWEEDRLDCEHRALSALELRTARLLGVPAHLEQAPPAPLCQQLQAMQGRYCSVKQRSREGLEAARKELEEREKVREELQSIQVWLETAGGVMSEVEQSSSTRELQEVHSHLCTHKVLLQQIMESLRMKYSDMYSLVPVEIEGQLKEVKQSLQQVEVKVGEAVEKSGPVHRLWAKLTEIHAGLRSVQKRLEQRSPTVAQAKVTQKRVWDELDVWHSRVAALEVDMQDLDKPEETLFLTERLVEVQQLHSQLAKQAEQRTALLSKIHMWLQQHREMIKSSQSWMAEAQSWLAAPCTYTTAKCLYSHVHALQTVLDDSAQIRSTLQGFSSVLKEMSQVCEITTLQEQLLEADGQVASVQDSFTVPLSQLEHAAAEMEAIESEVRQMESDVTEIKTLLSSPETFPSPREERLKAVEQRIQSMRRTIAEIQKCKPGLCLPENAEETLSVFSVVDQLQTLLLELEKKVPALFIQQPPTPIQAKAPTALQITSQPQLLKSASVEAGKEDTEQGQIRIARVQADALKRSGAQLLTVERSSPEQRQPPMAGSTQAEEATEEKGSEQQRVEEGGGGVLWRLWGVFLGASPQEPLVVVPEETEAASEESTEQTGGDRKDVEGPTDTTEASSSEALSKPLGTVRTQSQPESMVNTASTVNVSKSDSGSQQRCVVS